MADDAPTKPKRIVLGPGLFSPDIQVGPEKAKAEKAPEILVARPQVEALFKSLDSDSDGKLNKEELFDLVLGLGNQCVNTAAAAFTKLNSGSKTGLIRWEQVLAPVALMCRPTSKFHIFSVVVRHLNGCPGASLPPCWL